VCVCVLTDVYQLESNPFSTVNNRVMNFNQLRLVTSVATRTLSGTVSEILPHLQCM